MTQSVELYDVQALVRSGFGTLGAARYILLRVGDVAAVKAWLADLQPTRASAVGQGELDRVLQIAFTCTGLQALGFTPDELIACAPEFLDGMASDERRSHRLGDVGSNAPSDWRWGTNAREPHILLLLLAKKTIVTEWAAAIEQEALAAGCTLVASLESCPAREDGAASHEPFGFADGMSQPEIDWEGRLAVTGSINRDYRNGIAAGEVLLGYSNEYGFVPDHPDGKLYGRNGTYLVYRQLEQDVVGFWQWVALTAGADRAQWFAERMVGRGIDGRPMPGLYGGADGNGFVYKQDPDGRACPLGSHVRRTNPRSGDDPLGRRGFVRDLLSSIGLEGEAARDAVASARFHRLLRRGRAYGPTLCPEEAMREDQPPVEAGLHFICLNASLARQFEFVQGAWVTSPTFGGLSQESDPLLGNRQPFPDERRTDLFRYYDDRGIPCLASRMPQFVTVRGGAYFFLPGLAGLASIAAR